MRTWIKIDPTGKTKEQLFKEIAKVNPLSAGKRDRDYSTVENVRWYFRGDSKEQILKSIYFYNAYGDIANWEVGWMIPERRKVEEALTKKGEELIKKYGVETYSQYDNSQERERKRIANKRAEENKAKMDKEWITYTHRYPGGYIPSSKINEALKEMERIYAKYLGSLTSSVGHFIFEVKVPKQEYAEVKNVTQFGAYAYLDSAIAKLNKIQDWLGNSFIRYLWQNLYKYENKTYGLGKEGIKKEYDWFLKNQLPQDIVKHIGQSINRKSVEKQIEPRKDIKNVKIGDYVFVKLQDGTDRIYGGYLVKKARINMEVKGYSSMYGESVIKYPIAWLFAYVKEEVAKQNKLK